jgi:hypothetical protein
MAGKCEAVHIWAALFHPGKNFSRNHQEGRLAANWRFMTNRLGHIV